MALPSPLVLVLLALLPGTPSSAQSQPSARERQERQVVIPSGPDEPVPEVRVAARTLTLFRFGATIDRASVEVEGWTTRFRVVDVGDQTLSLEPSVEPRPGEKLRVRVRYKDGATPAYATFFLVSHPTLVDKEVEVVRRPRTPQEMEAALAEMEAELATLRAVSGPAGLAFSGRLDLSGVRARPIVKVPTGTSSGLKVVRGEAYRAGSWALVIVRVLNLPGQSPWAPGEARLTLADGTPVKVLSVDMNQAQLGPGKEGLVAVETETPFWNAEEALRLEFLDKSGSRRLLIPEVNL